jgi:ribonucleoside-triphosphate reductase
MVRLSDDQIKAKVKFIETYMGTGNAATSSKLDANANVTVKNIATLSAELFKDFTIQVNRALITEKLKLMYGPKFAKNYTRDIDDHNIYVHDESSLMPYCTSISMYPFLLNGLKDLGGESGPPTHLDSYCGAFTNLVFAVTSQFAGAVATTEFLMCFDHFAAKDYGDNYLETNRKFIEQKLQHVVYVLNQPAAARSYQSPFWNISTFDKSFFEGLFGEFMFPDGSHPNWETFNKLQKFFHSWFREERKKSILTFPVVTHSSLTNGEDWVDLDWKDFVASEMSKGGEFFIYTSDTVASLSSCCRLRSAISENEFSYSLGAGGVMTGSKNVITINVNRIIQDGINIETILDRVHKYQTAFDKLYSEYFEHDMLTIYSAGFINLKKQFLTIGVNGVVEAAEYLGYTISDNEEYKNWLKTFLSTIKESNKKASAKYDVKFNTEFVPAENLGVKNASWDKADGLVVPRDCYNSYMYLVEDSNTSVFEKMRLHGGEILDNLDGGSAVHQNNNERLTIAQYKIILKELAVTGSNYFCENVPKTICNACGYVHPNNVDHCIKCESKDVDYAVRIIGYLKRIKNFSEDRQKEAAKRFYNKGLEVH